ncbi:hypothetical protein [Trichococcus shcherbakoviae]|uniref:Uncharacterized protein n=1 Tax=Trichococcus shcherbakoviae TaxID=2094020 RepID=A0A383TDC9_9LACT|nr:hypothetical protein [Trichococcus shcherbakoviae]SYZ77877.1 Hypothetical protein TART1_0647 [Trichococcus shcherbakoviae]
MFYYTITIQFAKADAPKFSEINELINNAIDVYNSRSLMAANPKQIVDKKIRDNLTLEVILESTQELKESMASKALRVFSAYLIDENINNNLSSYITGKRLFKMISTRLEREDFLASQSEGNTFERRTICVDQLNEQLINFSNSGSIEQKLNLIYEKLINIEQNKGGYNYDSLS